MLALCTLGFHYQERKHVQNYEHVKQKLQSFFELLVPSAIGLRYLLYGRQASSSKTTIQEVKVEKEINANKVMLHLVNVK